MSANGHDTLLNPVDFSIPNFPYGLLARDVNGDDQIDLAVISSETADSTQRTILHNGNIPASLENQQVGKTSFYVDPDFFKDQERISG
jgi:hypothetical protein